MSHLATRTLFLALLFALPAAGQAKQKEKDKPKPPEPEKFAELAGANMKKADVKSPSVIETDNLVVATALPESATKTLATALQKAFAMAAKGLKYDEGEMKMRLVVYAFADVDQFRSFQRSVLKVRPDPDEFTAVDVKSDVPYVAVSARRGEKTANFEALTGHELCRAMLTKKGGNARIPDWMKDGFARAVQMRANPSSAGTDRGAVQRMAPPVRKGAKVTPVADKAWSAPGKDRDLVAASLMDFLAFGPGAEKLGTLLNGLVPATGTDMPTFAAALMGADWTVEDLDKAWREWIAKGSPANK